MLRATILAGALVVIPAVASAQQPCTTDARHVVNEIYRHMLERSPDPGSERWVEALVSGRMTVRDVVRDVARSREHLQRFSNDSPDQVVGTLYRHILGRQPDPEGQRGFVDLAARRGLAAVVDQIVNSAEYQQSFGDWGVPGSGGVQFCSTGGRFSNRSRDRGDQRDRRFDYLDTNENGVITRNEWDGNSNLFNRLDTNRDGRLTRDEFTSGDNAR